MRILKALVVIVLVLLVVGGVALWLFPADLAYRKGAGYLGPVVLSGVRGTVWHGHADGISLFGRDLGEIDWTMPKIALLTGHVSADVRIRGNDVDAAGTVERDAGDGFKVHDVRFSFPASLLEPMLGIPDLRLLGNVGGLIDEATLKGGFLASATGNARWTEPGVAGAESVRVSDILADFAAAPNGGIDGRAHDDGQGNIAVSATFHADMAGFEADIVLRARNGDPRALEALQHVGAPQPDGSSRVVLRGRMFKLF